MIRAVGPDRVQGVPGRPTTPGPTPQANDFSRIFEERLSAVQFTGHAQERMAARQIQMSPGEMQQLQSAVDLARQKGARDALVLLDRRAFIVSVNNGTVVTAMPVEAGKVFTNIDSAIVM